MAKEGDGGTNKRREDEEEGEVEKKEGGEEGRLRINTEGRIGKRGEMKKAEDWWGEEGRETGGGN